MEILLKRNVIKCPRLYRVFLPLLLIGAVAGPASESKAQSPFQYEKLKDSLGMLDNDTVRIGVNLALGGSITFLADSKRNENIINNSDWGRQIQLSFYGGPQPFVKNGKQPATNWVNLGWNPIQSGDCKGNRSTILNYTNKKGRIYIKCRPMYWPLDNEPGDCTFETWITLKNNVVLVHNRLTNKRPDKNQYEGRWQELPASYFTRNYGHLVTYNGNRPFTNDEISHIQNDNPNGKPVTWTDWEATEHWSAAVDDNNWGIGLWNKGSQHIMGGLTGNVRDRAVTAYGTAYIAPTQQDILDYNIVYEFDYALILGSVQEIRSYVYAHDKASPLPSYVFNKDRAHWIYKNTADAGWPIQGFLNVDLTPKGFLLGPYEYWDAAAAPVLHLNVDYTATQATKGRVYWRKLGEKNCSDKDFVEFDIPKKDGFNTIDVTLKGAEGYTGILTGLKVVPAIDLTRPGGSIKVKSIGF